MSKRKPVYIISDDPARKDKVVSDDPAHKNKVVFGFEAYARTLGELIAFRDNRTPMVVGIYGPWRSGKTTLMEAIIIKLDELNKKGDAQLRRCKAVRFQAWKYAKEEEILAGLIEQILQTMKQDGFFESCKAKVEELVARFNLTKLIGEFSKKIVDPVTNRPYGKFIEAGGYRENEYWSSDGQAWREENRISQPQYWNEKDWSQPEHPVVGVSYHEAEAFAAWAGKRLPTEKEWERAARGTDGREYPWGNEFDPEKCNTAKSKIGKTTRVTRYPNGISPAGCYDMAGNVWEWTASWYDDENTLRVLRGGSWFNDRDDARCADRLRIHPDLRNVDSGFRCARTKN